MGLSKEVDLNMLNNWSWEKAANAIKVPYKGIQHSASH